MNVTLKQAAKNVTSQDVTSQDVGSTLHQSVWGPVYSTVDRVRFSASIIVFGSVHEPVANVAVATDSAVWEPVSGVVTAALDT